MRYPEKFSVAAWSNPSTVLSKAPSPFEFSKRFCSNENRGMNVSKFYQKGTSAVPPKFSSGSGCAEVQNSRPLPLVAPAPSSGIVPTSVPLNPPFFMVPYGVCQFETDQFRTPRDGMLSFSANAFPYFQDRNYGVTPYLMNAVTDRHPGLSSNQSPCFKEPNSIGSLPPHSTESSGQGEIGWYKTQTVLTSGKDKRRKLDRAGVGAEIMNPLKRPKINSELSIETYKPPKRELLLLNDVSNHFSGLGISSKAKQVDQTNVDVSLHLLLRAGYQDLIVTRENK